MWETRNTVKKDNSKMFIGGSTFVFFEKTKKKKTTITNKVSQNHCNHKEVLCSYTSKKNHLV